jgi:NADPH-dependent ferric siderophore reductase
MQVSLAYSLPQNPTVKASISVLTTYYVRVSDAAVVSVFISAETETVSNCRRCLAMDVRADSYNQADTPQYWVTVKEIYFQSFI